MKYPLFLSAILALLCHPTVAFVPHQVTTQIIRHGQYQENRNTRSPFPQADVSECHPALTRQRRSASHVQMQGLFGLGGPEIAVILIAVAFIIGPEKLGSMVGQMKNGLDDVPDEFKKIPEEFQKGMEEGEINARARNAKKMKTSDDDDA